MATAQSLDIGQSEEASPWHGSPAHASIGVAGIVDVNDDEENEAQLKFNEHELGSCRRSTLSNVLN
jgi:hypothetical protein